jgi:transposase InsO family protein
VSVRTLHRWEHTEPRRCGRPPRSETTREEAFARVAEQCACQGRGVGWRPVKEALPDLPTDLVQEGVKRHKQARRAEERARILARRISIAIRGRDIFWGLDATHLGRIDGKAVEGQTLLDGGTLKTLGLSVGDPVRARDAVALLESVRNQRGSLPLVLGLDNGPPYVSKRLERYAARQGIVLLFNEPRTPQHNARVERRHGELKEESGLGKGVVLRGHQQAGGALLLAARRLDDHRLRRTLGYRTATEYDRGLSRSYNANNRWRFYRMARCSLRATVPRGQSLRARRRAERAVILELLEEEKLITIRRGDGTPACNRADGIT